MTDLLQGGAPVHASLDEQLLYHTGEAIVIPTILVQIYYFLYRNPKINVGSNRWSSVTGISNVPDYYSNQIRQKTEGVKYTRVGSGCQRRRPMYIATYNPMTLRSDDNLFELDKELPSVKWDVSGFRKVRKRGEQQIMLNSGYTFCHCGDEGSSVESRHKSNLFVS